MTGGAATAEREAPRNRRSSLGRSGARPTRSWPRCLGIAALLFVTSACTAVQVRSAGPELVAAAEPELAAAVAAERGADAAGLLEALDLYLEVARTSYAQLFFGRVDGEEPPNDERRTALLDSYNYATQRFTELAFELQRAAGRPVPAARFAGWRIRLGSVEVRFADGKRPRELVPARSLELRGIRNVYARSGFGAPFVAVAAPPARKSEAEIASNAPLSPIEARFRAATAILRFEGATLAEALAARSVTLEIHDPLQTDAMRLGPHDVPLAGDFTAPYALWLAREHLGREARSALLRRRAHLDEPRIYMMQPYDRDRRVLVMLHGLGASPEAWVNVVNEVLGDADLRARYQVWQVFYPTNLPLPENRKRIRQTLVAAFGLLDPSGTAPASRGVTLVGHSMGGVLARLLVVESGDVLWNELFRESLAAEQRAKLAVLDPYLTLEPLPHVDTAVFIAAPHRGSPLASGWRGWLASHVVRLPLGMIERARLLLGAIATEAPLEAAALRKRGTSIDNLSDRNRYLKLTAELPVAAGVTYHSIVGSNDPTLPLAESSDGVVPYASAHLAGAASELVVASRHSVHDTPRAIAEIRRILRDADARRRTGLNWAERRAAVSE
jgi:pimeloyl-ACP methyl ester carboxylesterase